MSQMTISISTNFSFTPHLNQSNLTVSINQTNSSATVQEIVGRQYANISVPRWAFNSTCDWSAATYVDLFLAGMGVFYNALILFFPFFFSRMYNVRGGFLGSYALGCLLSSIYYAYFDIRFLASDDATSGEKSVRYALIIFLAYHLVLHTYLLTWDQYRSIFRCKGHLGYASRDRMTKITLIAWIGSLILPVVEACFMNNISGFPFSQEISQFRLVCMVIVLVFFWFIPLFITICWNVDLFCWLVRAIQNGHVVIVMPPEEEVKPDLDENVVKDDEDEDEEEELPTLPDDLRFEFARTTTQLATITIHGALVLPWISYHMLALLRTTRILDAKNKDDFSMYDTIFNCRLYLCVYCFAKIIPIFNPLGYFHYREEFRKFFRYPMRRGNNLEILREEQ